MPSLRAAACGRVPRLAEGMENSPCGRVSHPLLGKLVVSFAPVHLPTAAWKARVQGAATFPHLPQTRRRAQRDLALKRPEKAPRRRHDRSFRHLYTSPLTGPLSAVSRPPAFEEGSPNES